MSDPKAEGKRQKAEEKFYFYYSVAAYVYNVVITPLRKVR